MSLYLRFLRPTSAAIPAFLVCSFPAFPLSHPFRNMQMIRPSLFPRTTPSKRFLRPMLFLKEPLGPSLIRLNPRVFGWGAGVVVLTLQSHSSGLLRKSRFWVCSLVLGIWMLTTGVPVLMRWTMFLNRGVLVLCLFMAKPW